jgi:Tfp pilus assembly protein PilO
MKIPENVMIAIKAISPLIIIVILFVIVGKFGSSQISKIQLQIESARKDNAVLSQKLDILKEVVNIGTDSSNYAVAALPDSNPVIQVLSQIQILAGSQSITLSQLKSGSPAIDPTTSLSTVNISFNATGPTSQIKTFLNSINSFAPITIVDKIKITESAPGVSLASVTVKSFWSPFPTKVPAVTTAIDDLTSSEKQTLQDLSTLTQPVFNQIQPSQGGKSDPFSQ